jgi:hypothetical protein
MPFVQLAQKPYQSSNNGFISICYSQMESCSSFVVLPVNDTGGGVLQTQCGYTFCGRILKIVSVLHHFQLPILQCCIDFIKELWELKYITCLCRHISYLFIQICIKVTIQYEKVMKTWKEKFRWYIYKKSKCLSTYQNSLNTVDSFWVSATSCPV